MISELITDKGQIPWYRRPLVFTLLYVFITPVALIIMITGPNYYFAKSGYREMGVGLKVFLAAMGSLYLLIQLGRVLERL